MNLSMMNERWQKVTFGAAFVYTLVVPTVAVFSGVGWDSSLVLAGGGVAAMLFTRLSDIVRFRGLGIEAELQRKIDEANATIAQLQELALAVAEPVLTNLALQGYLVQLNNSDRYAMREKILKVLGGIGLKPEALVNIDSIFRQMFRNRLVLKALDGVQLTEGEEKTQLERLRSIENPPTADEVEAFLSERGLMTGDRKRYLEELRGFEKNGTLSNPTILD